jgi:hypothetical protein
MPHVYNPCTLEVRADDHEVEASLDYIERHCLKKAKLKIVHFGWATDLVV